MPEDLEVALDLLVKEAELTVAALNSVRSMSATVLSIGVSIQTILVTYAIEQRSISFDDPLPFCAVSASLGMVAYAIYNLRVRKGVIQWPNGVALSNASGGAFSDRLRSMIVDFDQSIQKGQQSVLFAQWNVLGQITLFVLSLILWANVLNQTRS